MSLRENKILDDIKGMLGIDEAYDVYDAELIGHINGALFELFQLGVGLAPYAFELETGEEKWVDFIGTEPNMAGIKNFIFFTVKLDFDPPQSGYGIDSMKRRIDEFKWRLNAQHDRPAVVVAELIEEEV